MKNKICQDSLAMRRAQNELEANNREMMNMTTNLQLAQRENEELKQENQRIKDSLNDRERDQILS